MEVEGEREVRDFGCCHNYCSILIRAADAYHLGESGCVRCQR